ncbi:rhombosortase [Stieleria sp. TO1_6]|uniref:rhombosortase n=1 Tax=Stieleria tagensis TaxID=2956795 RepID=UPI00209B8A83|nr:rhombosortase [Stieleria tagensis]MCO8125027.1 rhombosortase [Stieleria tagensis]
MSCSEMIQATSDQSLTVQRDELARLARRLWQQSRVTAIVTAMALVAVGSPTVTAWLQLDIAAVADGQWWRLITGHVTHFGTEHLFWDLLMFIGLGLACERQHPRHFALGLLSMSLGVSAAVMIWCPDVSQYRGLSGIDTGLFVWFVVDQVRQSLAGRDRAMALVWTAAGSLLVGKLIYEWFSGQILFVDASAFKPLVQSHLAGAAMGIVLSCGGWRR